MTDQEIRERREKIRVIVTEIFMAISVVALLVFLTLIVMGYKFNLGRIGTDEQVIERSGLVQVSSRPTGATILIDGGSSLLLKTNGSRTTSAAEHEISLVKEGYEGWSKKIKITEGLMYRLNYPRLFLKEREEEKVLDFTGVRFWTVSEDGGLLVYYLGGELRSLDLSVAKVTDGVVKSGEKVLAKDLTYAGIADWQWSRNGERAVFRADGEWMAVDLKNSVDIVSIGEYVKGVVKMKFESESGDKLLVLSENGSLTELAVTNGVQSKVVDETVVDFDSEGDKILYVTKKNEVKVIRVGEEEGIVLKKMEKQVQIGMMEYFQEMYFGMLVDGKLEVWASEKWPEGEEEEILEPVLETETELVDGKLEKKGVGMVLTVEEKNKKAVFDVEARETKIFEIMGENGWVDEFLRFEKKDGELWVCDYDGENWRKIVDKGVTENFARISANNKYFYYIKDGKLYRQKII